MSGEMIKLRNAQKKLGDARFLPNVKDVKIVDGTKGNFSSIPGGPGQVQDQIAHFLFISFSSTFFYIVLSTRAGHFRYFFIFSIIKNYFFALFIKLITYFCTSPI